MARLPKLRFPRISLPTQPRKRRLALFALGFGAWLIISQIPGLFFTWWLGYPWENHGLSVQWRILCIVVDVVVVLAFLLTEVKSFHRRLPQLYLLMLGLLLFCVWSSLYLAFVERSSPFAFQLLMWHMFAGRTAAPLLAIYLFQHVIAWRTTSTPVERKMGKRLTIYTAVTLGVGFLFTVLGGPDERIFLPIHEYGSLLLPILVVWHIRAERRWRERTGPSVTTLAARVPSFGRRGTLIALAISVLLPLAPWSLSTHWTDLTHAGLFRFVEATPKDLYRTEPVPASYERPFGTDPFAPARLTTPNGELVPERFLAKAEGCAYEGCHTDIGKQWAVSGHRHSRNPFVEKGMAALAAERGVAATRYCAGCHDPISLAAGEVETTGAPATGVDNEGVSCLVCHAAAHVDARPGNASLALGATPIFFERNIDKSAYLMVVLYLEDHKRELDRRGVIDDVALCEACHHHVVPGEINPHRPTITSRVAEWRESPFARAADAQDRRDCRSCHMPPTPESYQSTEIKGHRFLSSNTALPSLYAGDAAYDAYATRYFRGVQQAKFTHAENLEWTRARLAAGIVDLELAPAGDPAAGSLAFTATVTNRGVGHGWPAGIPDLVDVWLQLEAKDGAGNVMWSSGVPDPRGRVPDDAYRFGEEWFDDQGNRLTHHETWKLAEIRNERRIQSGAHDVARFDVPILAGVTGPVTIEARLRHRRFRRDFIDWVLGPEGELPITDLAHATLALGA